MDAQESEITWSVVKFVGDNTVNVVPTCWIHNEDKCYWPPLPADKITQAIKLGLLNTHWPSHKITIFRNATYDSYEVARAKSRKAEDTSDLNTTEDEMSNDNKKRRRIIRNYSSSDEEIAHDNDVYVKPPPTLKKSSSEPSDINKELVSPTCGHLEVDDDTPYSCRTALAKEELILRSQNVVADVTSLGQTPRSAPRNNLDFVSGSSTNDNSCGCCPDVKRFLKEILRQQHLIRTLLNDLEQQINRNNVPHRPEDDCGESIFSGFDLPINTVNQFTVFNEFVNIGGNFTTSVAELSKTGGNNIYEFVKRILSMIITNELASQYSWLGRREKYEFSKLPFAKVIILAAEKVNMSLDKKKTENSIAMWLRRAKDRLNNKNK